MPWIVGLCRRVCTADEVGPSCRSVSALKEAYGVDAVTEAGLAILEQQFPAYSRPALKELLEAAGGDVSSALDSMSFLEAEHSNHRASTKPAKGQVYHQHIKANVLLAEVLDRPGKVACTSLYTQQGGRESQLDTCMPINGKNQ